jgi:hypothetical protein
MSRLTLADLISEFVNRMKGREYAFIGAIGVRAYGISKRTLDMDLIAKGALDFEAACLSLAGIGLKEAKPKGGFSPGFAKWVGEEIGADVMLGKLWLRAQVGGRVFEQKITPDEEFWKNVRQRGRETFGVDIPVPSPVDLAVLKAVSSVAPFRSPFKASHDREHALELIRRFSIPPERLRDRARAMGCLEPVERFLSETGGVESVRTAKPDK